MNKRKQALEKAKRMKEGHNLIGGGKIVNRLYPGGYKYEEKAKGEKMVMEKTKFGRSPSLMREFKKSKRDELRGK